MNPGEGDTAGIAGELNGLAGGVLHGCAVDGAVDAALACGAQDFFKCFGRVEGGWAPMPRANWRRWGTRLDGPDAACAWRREERQW